MSIVRMGDDLTVDAAPRSLSFDPIAVTGSPASLIPASAWPWIIGVGLLLGVWYFAEKGGRRVRSNPDGDIEGAERSYEGFHWGRRSRKRLRVRPSPQPGTLVKLGRLEAVTYSTKKGAEPFAHYEHCFGEEGGRRPTLAMDPRNRRLHIVGGDYDVEDRGIVD